MDIIDVIETVGRVEYCGALCKADVCIISKQIVTEYDSLAGICIFEEGPIYALVSDLLRLPYHTKDLKGRCCRSKVGDCFSITRETDISRLEGVSSRVIAADEGPNAGLIVVAVAVEQGKTFDITRPAKITLSAISFNCIIHHRESSRRVRLAGKCNLVAQMANHGYRREAH